MGYQESFIRATKNANIQTVYEIMNARKIPQYCAKLCCFAVCKKEVGDLKIGEKLLVIIGERDVQRGKNVLCMANETMLTAREKTYLSKTKIIPIDNLIPPSKKVYQEYFEDIAFS